MSEGFSESWLALREPCDAAARSRALALRLGSVLPAEARLIDLGAGSGSLLRWLAPILGATCPRQHWTLFDADGALLRAALLRIASWAEAQGGVARIEDGVLGIEAPWGECTVRARQGDLADPTTLPFGEVDAVLCTALADLFSGQWIDSFAGACTVPFLAALSVDGRVVWRPAHPTDRLVEALFRRDQRREKGLGAALGPDAPARLARAFEARGARVWMEATDWRIGRPALSMLAAMIDGHAEAAAQQAPMLGPRIGAWRAARLAQAARARLSLDIGHQDLLALPRSVRPAADRGTA